MRDPIENVTRLQKQLNHLQLENQVLKNILDKAGLSYQNELASIGKGTDKILQKLGEECTEIVIAAKNTDHEHLKYEISDYIYHLMVLMAEKDITWEEITQELSQRK